MERSGALFFGNIIHSFAYFLVFLKSIQELKLQLLLLCKKLAHLMKEHSKFENHYFKIALKRYYAIFTIKLPLL